MANTTQYQRLLFPERAESLPDAQFTGYRVFLNHWSPLAAELRDHYESMVVRGSSHALVVSGPQGSGKTLFANKLVRDFDLAKRAARGGSNEPDDDNLWHRVTGGRGMLSRELIDRATLNTDLHLIENEPDWVQKAIEWKAGRPDRHCVIVADNAERSYFRRSLLAVDDGTFLQAGGTPQAYKTAAEKLVALCRRELRGCLIVMLTNDDDFALEFTEAVSAQHEGLASISPLPLPLGADKETVVRVNTNRLNPFSYWYCLDQAGPAEKLQVYESLAGASTFPDSFKAVDRALNSADQGRTGRPAKKALLSLVVLHPGTGAADSLHDRLGADPSPEASEGWARVTTFGSGWAANCLDDRREANLLESEWQLRLVTLGNPFVAALLSGNPNRLDACKKMLEVLRSSFSPGTRAATRERFGADICDLVTNWPAELPDETKSFWAMGNNRSALYEHGLASIVAGYNTGGRGYLSARPDIIVSPYQPCSVLKASAGRVAHINSAIKREAHAVEFVASRSPTVESVRIYLADKLPNYVHATQEQ